MAESRYPMGERRFVPCVGCGREMRSYRPDPVCQPCRRRGWCGSVRGFGAGCRCGSCRAAKAESEERSSAPRQGPKKSWVPCSGCGGLVQSHLDAPKCQECRRCDRCGTANGYRKGCRCGRCREAIAEDHRAYRARKRAEGVDVTARYRKLVSKVCPSCGGGFEGRSGQEFCSRGCIGGPKVVAECGLCGAVFRGVESRVYCSDRCKLRARDDLRRARERGAFVAHVDREAVFERDGWVCQICMERIDRRTKYPHPRSASLDHIVPLSAGGTHEPRNAQCAHLRCNIQKNAGSANDQLRLIG